MGGTYKDQILFRHHFPECDVLGKVAPAHCNGVALEGPGSVHHFLLVLIGVCGSGTIQPCNVDPVLLQVFGPPGSIRLGIPDPIRIRGHHNDLDQIRVPAPGYLVGKGPYSLDQPEC